MKTNVFDMKNSKKMIELIPENSEELTLLIDMRFDSTYIGDHDKAFGRMRRVVMMKKEGKK